MIEDDVPYENTLSVESLRIEVRERWDLERDLAKALKELPEVPSSSVLKFLDKASVWPTDWERGKKMQKEYGSEAIYYKTELESGAGVWWRIRQGLLSVKSKS